MTLSGSWCASEADGVGPRRATVVVADDEAIIRMSMRAILTDLGYEVIGDASDGQSAVDLARQLSPDLVVMDIRMPGMDGLEAGRILTEERIAPVLLVTGYSERELAAQARLVGVAGYIAKPFSESELVAAVESVLSADEDVCSPGVDLAQPEEDEDTRRTVAWARGILMARRGLSEREATRVMEEMSATTGRSLLEVSEDIIRGQ